MRNKSRLFRGLAIVTVVFLLVAVRLMEKEWFPEPLIDFFGKDLYLENPIPPLSPYDYFTVLFRYAVNAVLSVVLLYLLFEDRDLTRAAVRIFLWAGVLLFAAYVAAIHFYRPGHYRLLFYIRRLLVHPVILFVLIPAFYYLRSLKTMPRDTRL
ncbi:MAG: exosortase F system-associated protein [Chlorobi bacterium]|nr:exosortase F system-associated protein [Chlorobiota bacterium]